MGLSVSTYLYVVTQIHFSCSAATQELPSSDFLPDISPVFPSFTLTASIKQTLLRHDSSTFEMSVLRWGESCLFLSIDYKGRQG